MALSEEAPFICSEGPPAVQAHSFARTQSASRATGELRLLSYVRLPTPLFLENNTFHIRYHLGQLCATCWGTGEIAWQSYIGTAPSSLIPRPTRFVDDLV
jgi:hypothetical protein